MNCANKQFCLISFQSSFQRKYFLGKVLPPLIMELNSQCINGSNSPNYWKNRFCFVFYKHTKHSILCIDIENQQTSVLI